MRRPEMVTSRAGQGKLSIVSSYKGRPAYEKRHQFEDTFFIFCLQSHLLYFILLANPLFRNSASVPYF